MAGKSRYNAEYHIDWIEGLARRGCTLDEMANDLGVARSTLCKWIKDNPELSDAIKRGRDYADIRVEKSLYQRAMGFSRTTKKTIIGTGEKDGQKPVRIEITEEEVPPDTTAIIFWLKNRNPKLWRDVQDINAKVATEPDLKPLTEAEIEMLRKLNDGKK